MRKDLFIVFRQAIKDEVDRIKNNFSQAIFRLERKRKLKRYIQFHQQAIIRLEGYLLNYANPDQISHTSNELDKATFCQYLYNSLEELLSFVGNQFPAYFDQDMWIPKNYRTIVLHQLKNDFETLETGLLKLGIEAELVSFSLHPISEFLDSNYSDVTYRKIIYIRELRKALFELIHKKNDEPKLELQWVLFQHNFNSSNYFCYCTKEINDYVNQTEDQSERLDKLALVQKLIHQYPVRPGYCYNLKLKSLKYQLSDWIAQEMDYLETRVNRLTAPVPDDPQTGFKIKTELSVSQLAYLLRVFIEINLIQYKSIASLLRVIPSIFQTKRTEHVGFSSLSGKYYKPETNTKKSVRELLLRMVKHIEKSEPLNWSK